MERFKVGDRVEVINGAGTNLAFKERIGEEGVIVDIKSNWFISVKAPGYVVKFDRCFRYHKTLVYLNTSLRHSKEKRVLEILRNAISKGVIGKTRV